MQKLPEYLNDVVVGDKFRRVWRTHMVGWVPLHTEIAKESRNEQFFLKLLKIELQRGIPRKGIVKRMYGAYSIRRTARERLEVEGMCTDWN